MVREVTTLDEYKKILEESGNKLVVVDFTSKSFGFCQRIFPIFEKMSEEPGNNNVVFLKVDVDEAADVSRYCGIICMPTFRFYKGGEKVGEFLGAEEYGLTDLLIRLRNK